MYNKGKMNILKGEINFYSDPHGIFQLFDIIFVIIVNSMFLTIYDISGILFTVVVIYWLLIFTIYLKITDNYRKFRDMLSFKANSFMECYTNSMYTSVNKKNI